MQSKKINGIEGLWWWWRMEEIKVVIIGNGNVKFWLAVHFPYRMREMSPAKILGGQQIIVFPLARIPLAPLTNPACQGLPRVSLHVGFRKSSIRQSLFVECFRIIVAVGGLGPRGDVFPLLY